jgi:hypothetical protein
VKLWGLEDGNPIQIPDYDVNILGQVTAIKWSSWGIGNGHRVVIGSGLGTVLVWRFDMAEVSIKILKYVEMLTCAGKLS